MQRLLYICDRCGSTFTYPVTTKFDIVKLGHTKDLCQDCCDSLAAWWDLLEDTRTSRLDAVNDILATGSQGGE